MPDPNNKKKHHCKCGKSTKRASKLGYCPNCSEICRGGGTATTKGGEVRVITHKEWTKYQSEDCSQCKVRREHIEAEEDEECKMPEPNSKETHHCQCGKSMTWAATLGHCPKCSEICWGVGTATTKGGEVRDITHEEWTRYKVEECSQCKVRREHIEAEEAEERIEERKE
ncbi:hypothetical protein CY34DRAFT_551862 [Suillus luteus UH-Slu-Lm8-n1]|uniref:Uncharacterized protein n=1 Tax=Suillus luteus UH-Slu-Lm8-n1 TaxID=930992 RepID=A0A0D0A2K3_9AGAM|nr:hypothetical protein CY34DRAFT_551862 [Suillus luteus UH-Slu-Lm8-n1]